MFRPCHLSRKRASHDLRKIGPNVFEQCDSQTFLQRDTSGRLITGQCARSYCVAHNVSVCNL